MLRRRRAAAGRAALAALLLAAAPSGAQTSHCAQLPERVMAAGVGGGPGGLVRPTLTPQGLRCPRGFVAEGRGADTRCRRSGAGPAVERSPRRQCYQDLPLGPVDAVDGLKRPGFGCRNPAAGETILPIRGRNAGWRDIGLAAPPAAQVTVTQLTASGPLVPPEEDPAANDCFPHACRLVRITTRAGTPGRFDMILSAPGDAQQTRFTVTTEAHCPGP